MKVKKYMIITAAITLVLFLLSWFTPFCDFYASTVYGVISDVLGFIMGVLPVNVGECLMYLAVPVLALAVVFAVLLIFLHKKEGFRKFTINYLKLVACALLTVLMLYVTNWWVPLRSSLMGGAIEPVDGFSLEEIEAVRAQFVECINQLAEECPRDEEGKLIYIEEEDLRRDVSDTMFRFSPRFDRLFGYVPRMKPAYCSDVLDWMYIGGYTYPYTMEVTYNKYITKLYYPALFIHESAHHQGYYRENEANFIEFLIGSSCEDPRIRYAAYIDMYRYINGAYKDALYLYDRENMKDRYYSQVMFSELVIADQDEAYTEAAARYDADAHPLDFASDTATEISDTGWETQGELLGSSGYDAVVLLIMACYRE